MFGFLLFSAILQYSTKENNELNIYKYYNVT